MGADTVLEFKSGRLWISRRKDALEKAKKISGNVYWTYSKDHVSDD